MSQYSQQSYGQGQQTIPQYRGPTSSQQASSQYGASDPSSYMGQHSASQHAGPEVSSYGTQDDPAGYSAQEQGQQESSQYGYPQPQYDEQQPQENSFQQDGQSPNMNSEEPAQLGQEHQFGHQQQISNTRDAQNMRQQSSSRLPKTNGVNGAHNNQIEHHEPKSGMETEQSGSLKAVEDKSMTKPQAAGPVQHHQPQQPTHGSQRNYHPSHHNALYHMGKAAGNGFTTEHIDSFLHLGTYALGALANTHGLAPSEPHPGY